MLNPVILIPVHKSIPTDAEIFAIKRCFNLMKEWPIFFLCPDNIDMTNYYNNFGDVNFLKIDKNHMSSRRAYNKMMISSIIYQKLDSYSHILIHEPDALIIKDDLEYWCEQPYDYIGAPWFEGFGKPKECSRLVGVGNFGFSLIKVKTFIEITTSQLRWYPFRDIADDFSNGILGDKTLLKKSIRGLGNSGKLSGAAKMYKGNCDLFFSLIVQPLWPDFNVAPIDAAIKFAWEVQPRKCMEINEGRLPFGVHAWSKYDEAFIREILESNTPSGPSPKLKTPAKN